MSESDGSSGTSGSSSSDSDGSSASDGTGSSSSDESSTDSESEQDSSDKMSPKSPDYPTAAIPKYGDSELPPWQTNPSLKDNIQNSLDSADPVILSELFTKNRSTHSQNFIEIRKPQNPVVISCQDNIQLTDGHEIPLSEKLSDNHSVNLTTLQNASEIPYADENVPQSQETILNEITENINKFTDPGVVSNSELIEEVGVEKPCRISVLFEDNSRFGPDNKVATISISSLTPRSTTFPANEVKIPTCSEAVEAPFYAEPTLSAALNITRADLNTITTTSDTIITTSNTTNKIDSVTESNVTKIMSNTSVTWSKTLTKTSTISSIESNASEAISIPLTASDSPTTKTSRPLKNSNKGPGQTKRISMTKTAAVLTNNVLPVTPPVPISTAHISETTADVTKTTDTTGEQTSDSQESSRRTSASSKETPSSPKNKEYKARSLNKSKQKLLKSSEKKPASPASPAQLSDAEEEAFCFCREGEWGVMVQCDNCSEWYHDECLNLTGREIEAMETFYCSVCYSSHSKLVTIYKKKSKKQNKVDRSRSLCEPTEPNETKINKSPDKEIKASITRKPDREKRNEIKNTNTAVEIKPNTAVIIKTNTTVVMETEPNTAVMIETILPHQIDRKTKSTFNTAVVLETEPNTAVTIETEPNTAAMIETEPNTAVMIETEPNTTVTIETEPNTAVMKKTEPNTAVMIETESNKAVMIETESNTAVMIETESNTAVMIETEPNTAVMIETIEEVPHQIDRKAKSTFNAAKAVINEEKICEADNEKSSDDDWVDIGPNKEHKKYNSETEPSINFIAKTKEMLAYKTVRPDTSELVLPVESPIDLKRNEFWDEKFYKPHINEDLSSCFSQMSIDWENARKMFTSQMAVSPLKNLVSNNDDALSCISPEILEDESFEKPKTLSLTEPRTPTRRSVMPSPSDPEVMRIFEKSLLISPCKQVIRPKDKPSRRLSLIKLDDQVTMCFGKSPSPITAKEMGKKLFSGKHDWNVNAFEGKENSTPGDPSSAEIGNKSPVSHRIINSKKPLLISRSIDSAWAKGLDEINSDYPFYTLRNSKPVESSKNKSIIVVGSKNSTPQIKKDEMNNVAVKENIVEKGPAPTQEDGVNIKIETTPKKGRVDDSHLFKTPTKSVRRLRKKSISGDRVSEGWSPGSKMSEHSCPYDPTESGCYSFTVEDQTPLNVPLAPSLDSIMKTKPECTVKDEKSTKIKKVTSESIGIDNLSNDLSRSFDLQFEYPMSQKAHKSPVENKISSTVKSILPKLLTHLENFKPNLQSNVATDNLEAEMNEEQKPIEEITKDACSNESNVNVDATEMDSPSKYMKDIPSFIEAPVEDTLDFEEAVSPPAACKKNVLIGYSEQFCDDGEIFSSDDEGNEIGVRIAQRYASSDSSSNPVSASSSNEKLDIVNALNCKAGAVDKHTDVVEMTDREFLERNKAKYTVTLCVTDDKIQHTDKQRVPEHLERDPNDSSQSLPLFFQPIHFENTLIETNSEAIEEKRSLETLSKDHEVRNDALHTAREHEVIPSSSCHPKRRNEKTTALLPLVNDEKFINDSELLTNPPKTVIERNDCLVLNKNITAKTLDFISKSLEMNQEECNESTTIVNLQKQPYLGFKEGRDLQRDNSLSEMSHTDHTGLTDSIQALRAITLGVDDEKNVDAVYDVENAQKEHMLLEMNIQDILRSDEALSNPSVADPYPDRKFGAATERSAEEKDVLSEKLSLSKKDFQQEIVNSLITQESLPDYTPPAESMVIPMHEKTPLSSMARLKQNTPNPKISTEDTVASKTREDSVATTVSVLPAQALNMLLASEETMSSWTPEPSPIEAHNSDSLVTSFGAKRRISLHDYVIRKENDSNTPVSPKSAFSTPDYAKNKSLLLSASCSQTPLAIEFDSQICSKPIECTQSPVPMMYETSLTTNATQTIKQFEAKLKYHHLIPIQIPPKEFLYCRRVKLIQDMLINELVSGVDFKGQQTITQPLCTTRQESSDSTAARGRINTRSRVETVKSLESDVATSFSKVTTSTLRQDESQLSKPLSEDIHHSRKVQSSVQPSEENSTKPSKSVALPFDALDSNDILPHHKNPISTTLQLHNTGHTPKASKVQVDQNKILSLNALDQPISLDVNVSPEISENLINFGNKIISGMEDPSLNDEESHEYFKKLKIPKVLRVTDSFMSEDSVIHSYDCEPETITVGNYLQKSTGSDKVLKHSSNKNLYLDTSKAQSAKLDSTPSLPRSATSAFKAKRFSLPTDTSTPIAHNLSSKTDNLLKSNILLPADISASVEKVSDIIKRCLFSDEDISQSPVLESATIVCDKAEINHLTLKAPESADSNHRYVDAIPSQSISGETDVANTDITSKTYHPLDLNSSSPNAPTHQPTCNTNAETEFVGPMKDVTNNDSAKPPKFRIPKKDRTLSTSEEMKINHEDRFISSPSKIKNFVAASDEPAAGSTLFTQRKKKQLDVILSKERQQREQVLQQYLSSLEQVAPEQSSSVQEEVSSSSVQQEVASSSVQEEVASLSVQDKFGNDPKINTRKRRKTDSPDHKKSFDLRNLLSTRNASSKPETKRSRTKCSDDETCVKGKLLIKFNDKIQSSETLPEQLNFKNSLFEALAVLNSKENLLVIPNPKAGKRSSLSSWLEGWKNDEATLKELRTARLQIRDSRYQPRDLSKLKFSDISRKKFIKRSIPVPEKSLPAENHEILEEVPEKMSGWEARKPDFCHETLFPPQQSSSTSQDQSLPKDLQNSSKVLTNPLLNKIKSMPKDKSTTTSNITAPEVWTECMKRADDSHCQYKRIRKKSILDIMTTKENGPLGTLQRALTCNLKVTVLTRTFKGVRGECTGYIVAYDRYMNLALSDVTESYRSNYHKPHEKSPPPNSSEPGQQPNSSKLGQQSTCSSDTKPPEDRVFVNFKRTVVVDPALLRGVRSPSHSPTLEDVVAGRRVDSARHGPSKDLKSPIRDFRSPGGSIGSPEASPPPSISESPVKIGLKPKYFPPPGLLGWAYHTPEYRKFKYTKNRIITRYCKQVFLRGDSVILVRLVE